MVFVTLSNEFCAPGVYSLINSMIQNSGINDLKFHVLKLDDFSDRWQDRTAGLGDVVFQDATDLGVFKARGKIKVEYLVPALQKMLVFKLPYDENVAWMDTDMVCINEVKMIRDMTPFSVCLRANLQPPINFRPQFNAAFFVFRPSEETYGELQEYALSDTRDLREPEQVLMNRYFLQYKPEIVNYLDPRFNLGTAPGYIPKKWDWKQSKFLHYVGMDKPWLKNYKGILKDVWGKYAYSK
jgi:lipopolysaccharide biosynthesis glycosyltransferase